MGIPAVSGVTTYSTARIASKPPAEAASKSWYEEAYDWAIALLDAPPPAVTACDDWTDNTQAPPIGDGSIDPNGDGGLDVDPHGYPEITEDTFTITGDGRQFQFSPAVSWTSQPLGTSGLRNTPIYVQVGLDPTVIETPNLSDQCFDGLINTTPISGDDIACYENLLACPNDPSSRMPVYLAEVTITGWRWNSEARDWEEIPTADPNARVVLVSEGTLINEDFDFNTLEELKLGVFCEPGDVEGSAGEIRVPAEFHADGNLRLTITTRFLTNGWAQSENRSYTYESRAFVRLHIPEE